MIKLIKTEAGNPEFQQLVALLDEDLKIRDGDDHAFYAQFNKTVKLRNVIVCYVDDKAVGCGAFREFEPGKVEIKRMYVLPAYRGRVLASAILLELETWAADLNYAATILETGKNQPEAINLYKKAGYTLTGNYGQYQNVENSVCMKKYIEAI